MNVYRTTYKSSWHIKLPSIWLARASNSRCSRRYSSASACSGHIRAKAARAESGRFDDGQTGLFIGVFSSAAPLFCPLDHLFNATAREKTREELFKGDPREFEDAGVSTEVRRLPTCGTPFGKCGETLDGCDVVEDLVALRMGASRMYMDVLLHCQVYQCCSKCLGRIDDCCAINWAVELHAHRVEWTRRNSDS